MGQGSAGEAYQELDCIGRCLDLRQAHVPGIPEAIASFEQSSVDTLIEKVVFDSPSHEHVVLEQEQYLLEVVG